jgi:hypothetical protein
MRITLFRNVVREVMVVHIIVVLLSVDLGVAYQVPLQVPVGIYRDGDVHC